MHLWFLGHLLLYAGAYVVWRHMTRSEAPRELGPPPDHAAIIAITVTLAVVTWGVRVWYPVGRWAPLMGLVAAEPAYLPQYVCLFVVGLAAHRGDWLRRMRAAVGYVWLAVGLLASAGIYALHGFGRWNLLGDGGPNVPSLVRSSWESVICVSVSVGLIVLFRGVFRRPRRLLDAMARDTYGAYILHLLIVVALQVAILRVELPVIVKFGLVVVLGNILAFGLAHLLSRTPGVRFLLGAAPDTPGDPSAGPSS
jgi:hypothetical protein